MRPDLQQQYDQLEDFFENGAVGLHIVGADGIILRVNKAELEMLGYDVQEYVGRHISEFHADQAVIDDVLKRLTCGEKLDKYPATLLSKDGSVKQVLISSSAQFRDGQFISTRCFTVDVTDRVRAEELRRQRDEEYHQLLDALPAAVYTTDAAGMIKYFNAAAVELAGRRPAPGEQWCVNWRLFWPDGTPLPHDQCPMAIALKENRAIRGVEAIAERPDGTRVPFLPFPTPLHDASGRLIGAINMMFDLSERKLAEETQRLLVQELDHRVKNTLATVQALAQQTQRRAESPEHFVSSFGGRLQALARAHNRLSDTSWKNAELSDLVRDQVVLSGPAEERITWTGPPRALPAQSALRLALVLHELATNARKHGALSQPDGMLAIDWSLVGPEARMLRLNWRETSSSPVMRFEKRGLGTLLIEQLVEANGGEAVATVGKTGATWAIDWHLADAPPVETHLSAPVMAPSDHQSRASIAGTRILIIEDEVLIGLELTQILADAGADVVAVCRNGAEARRAISGETFDVALLDANLGGEPVEALAASLESRGIGFAFVTGYSRDGLPPAFRQAPLVRKPFTPEQIIEVVEGLVGAAAEIATATAADVPMSARDAR